MSALPKVTMAMSVVLVATKQAGGKLERCKSGYWRVPGRPHALYHNDIVRRLVAHGAMRYSKRRHYRGKYIAKEAVVVGQSRIENFERGAL